jgi:hypothetical protein
MASPVAQPHMPPLQVSPLAQVLPQPPQFFGSVCSSSHRPLQRTNPAWHMSTQFPPLQVAVPFGSAVMQTFPQAPQLFALICSLTQTRLQEE